MIDPLTQRLICTGLPDIMIGPTETHDFLVRCKQFRARKPGTKPTPFIADGDELVDSNGLYPGQMPLQPDYSDYDSEEEGNDSAPDDKECKT